MRLTLVFAVSFSLFSFAANAQDYHVYHSKVRMIENSLLTQDWNDALEKYLELEKGYDFLFAKDLKIALQLAYRARDSASFQRFSEAAFARGWEWKKAKKELKENPDFPFGMGIRLKSISKNTEKSEVRHPEIREQVKKLFIQDQWQALGALFTFSSHKRERYAERKFAPKAKLRVERIQEIIKEIGCPGEMLIGNFVWASTILSHYNSMSEELTKADILYPAMKITLQRELGLGRISPFEFALIDNWYQSVKSGRTVESYGILEGEVSEGSVASVDANRLAVGLPPIGVYNQLLAVQNESRIRLFFGQAWGGNSPIGIKN